MSITQARVLAIGSQTIQISVAEQSVCGGCRSKTACGVGTIREIPVDAWTQQTLHVGDEIELSMATSLTLNLTAMLYTPPIAGFLLGMVVMNGIYANDAITLTGGVVGLGIGFGVTRWLGRFVKPQSHPEIRIL